MAEAAVLRAGFGRRDLTPRVGVELCGFGPYIQRRSAGVRDRLWARAVALDFGGRRLVLVSCDLIGVTAAITRRVRSQVEAATGIPADAVMLHCTHTHSGPACCGMIGWGEEDAPWLELLPGRIAAACVEAVGDLREACLFHAVTPCEGVGLNREYDRNAPPLDEVLREDWRPARPERTDTACQVLVVKSPDGTLRGFLGYFGCHPVVCCEATHQIHGDYCGVATNGLEREHPGATGLFLQGAQGDVNTCAVHQPEPESLAALDIIAERFARALRRGIAEARPLAIDRLACIRQSVSFSRKAFSRDELEARLRDLEAVVQAPGARDEAFEVRIAMVRVAALRRILADLDAGRTLAPDLELQGFRLGPIALLAAPFEIFQAIKSDVCARARAPIPLVLGITNDNRGYAVDRETAARGGYAQDNVPLILGSLPYADMHAELVAALLRLDGDLFGDS